MKLLLCAVLDKKTGAFTPPNAFRSKGEAIRSFMDAVTAEGSQFGKHAMDYVFCSVAVYNDETGEVSGQPEQLITAVECLKDK